MKKLKTILRYLLAAMMVLVGVSHFMNPAPFVRIVPPLLPFPLALVYISGFFEVAGGIGLLIPPLRKYAAWGLIALYIAVFPANIYMAIHQIPFGDAPQPVWVLWARLPFQFLFIAWAYWLTKPDQDI